MNFKKLVPAIVVLVLVGGVTWFGANQRSSNKSTQGENLSGAAATATPAYSYTYQGENDKTALAILQEKYTVVTQSFSFGEMVQSINGLDAGNTHYWAFKVNGQDASVGADAYTTQDFETIEWVYTAL